MRTPTIRESGQHPDAVGNYGLAKCGLILRPASFEPAMRAIARRLARTPAGPVVSSHWILKPF